MTLNISGKGLVAAALIFGLLLPVGAYAAGSLVEISSSSGRTAQVGRANQLYAAETSPEKYRRGGVTVVSSGCYPLILAADNKALVVNDITVETYSNPSPSQFDWVAAWADVACSDLIGYVTPTGTGLSHFQLGPGLAIPAGGGVYVTQQSEVAAFVTAFGYDVPAVAVSAETAAANASQAQPPRSD